MNFTASRKPSGEMDIPDRELSVTSRIIRFVKAEFNKNVKIVYMYGSICQLQAGLFGL